MTITHAEMSLIMDRIVSNSKSTVWGHGYTTPTVFFMRRGSVLIIGEEEGVEECYEDESDTDPAFGIYRSMIGFRLSSNEDIDRMDKTIRKITARIRPDAVGMVMPCVYNEFPENNMGKKEELDKDPESIRILHTAYWLAEEPGAVMMITPYVSRGELKSYVPVGVDSASRYEVGFADYLWTRPNWKVQPRFRNPWGK